MERKDMKRYEIIPFFPFFELIHLPEVPPTPCPDEHGWADHRERTTETCLGFFGGKPYRNDFLMEYFIQNSKDFVFRFVWMDGEIGVSRKHRRKLRLVFVVENMAGYPETLGISQFVADAK